MQTMHSYPFIVRFSQLGELNSSLGASEPMYKLEVIYSTHIGSLRKLLNTSEVEALVNYIEFNLILSKIEHPCESPELQTKRQKCESVQFDPLSIGMCITILVLGYSM